MADVAASGGYYMAMAAQTIVAENLTLTGSIGVVTGVPFASVVVYERDLFMDDEAELFAKSAQNAYRGFRDKAASSRSMTIDKMEEVAQGRVWTGNDAASRGLVDAVGGLSRAVAIAKQKANLPMDEEVTLVELSRPSTSLPELLGGLGGSIAEADKAIRELLEVMASSSGIQARMDGIMMEQLGGSYANTIFTVIKDYLSSL
ncbi:hypothetical protein SASPL_125879 [Salvia splendens]|uniref:Peptidase S49 domain-containing protein n=1 Tax=Salvia splendens TaxID=180675 RepID=A0A8X8XEK6_SALSN|nr:hypothetical protein SASPL_125879 [Salvia splendens]